MLPKILIPALMLAFASPFALATAPTDKATFECAMLTHDGAALTVAAVSGSVLTNADAEKLQRAACRVAGAATALEGHGSSWIRNIQVTAYEGTDRLPLDAYLAPASSSRLPVVSITRAFVEEASEDQLVAILGHEIGHAVHDDASDAAYLRIQASSRRGAGLGLLGGALGGKLLAASWAAGGVIGVIGAGAVYAQRQCSQTYLVEKTADLYGARLLAQEGRSWAEAVDITAGMIELLYRRNQPVTENFWNCLLPGSTAHPKASERIDYLRTSLAPV